MAGGYPCCCTVGGSTQEPGSSLDLPLGSSGGGPGAEDDFARGSSYAGTFTCANFQGSVAPAVLRVEVSGVTSKSCADCPSLDGVYFVEATLLGLPDRCAWELYFPAVCGHYIVMHVELFAADVGDYAWSVLLSDRPFVAGQELLYIGGGQMTAGRITIADVNNVLLNVPSEINATRCTVLGGGAAIISAVV